MSTTSSRLDRLLQFLAVDATNLSLRKDAVAEACGGGEWQMALDLLQAGLQSHPQEPELLAHLGFVYLHLQKYQEAELALAAVVKQGIEVPELTFNLALALLMQERYADALDHLSAPGVAAALPYAYLLRARCQHHLERPHEAIADCRSHLVLEPAHAETHGLLALLLCEQRQHELALEHAATALKEDPQQLEAMLTNAMMQSDAREYAAARDTFDALLREHPGCGRGWLGLALVDLMQRQLERAKQHIDLAALHMPEHIGTWHVLAWIQIMRGDVSGAADAFQEAYELNRNFGETHGGLAVIAALQGREEDARASIRRARLLDPQSMSLHYAEVLLLQREGRHDEARGILEAVLDRPAAQGDLRYRDLVSLHLSELGMRAGHA